MCQNDSYMGPFAILVIDVAMTSITWTVSYSHSYLILLWSESLFSSSYSSVSISDQLISCALIKMLMNRYMSDSSVYCTIWPSKMTLFISQFLFGQIGRTLYRNSCWSHSVSAVKISFLSITIWEQYSKQSRFFLFFMCFYDDSSHTSFLSSFFFHLEMAKVNHVLLGCL